MTGTNLWKMARARLSGLRIRDAIAILLLVALSILVSTSMAQSEEIETDLIRDLEVNDPDYIEGGFSSLDGMLQWSIGHSDPVKLKKTADDVRHLSTKELEKRQREVKELLDSLNMPSDARMMKIAIDDLNNSSLSLEDRRRAFDELLILVEPIDNANDLDKLGGLVAVIQELDHSDSDIRMLSAWIIGKASQNNLVVQIQALNHGALTKLMKSVKSSCAIESNKALYAISALIRNNLPGQEMFFAEAGDVLLQDILSNSINDIRLRKKAVSLVSDLAAYQLYNAEKAETSFPSNLMLLKSVADLTTSTDLDFQEMALTAIKNLLQLETTNSLIFKDFCDLDAALESMKMELLDLLSDDDQRDYAVDVENLRQEVEAIFHRKLGRVDIFGF